MLCVFLLLKMDDVWPKDATPAAAAAAAQHTKDDHDAHTTPTSL